MICRNCGTEIADKAIVCYRCGTGTREPLRKPAEIRRKRAPLWLVFIVFVIVALVALFLSRNYHLLGLHLALVDDHAFASCVLIDFPPGHA